ncbi:MAG: dethiobiotin synthase [Crocinitomicaceae bacterium]|nr:dethiobiotin synthase [Crocinitomicaceae bacterium]
MKDIMKLPESSLFVTGIGTDVGKTVVSAILCEYFGFDYWKPIQTGKNLGTDNESLKSLVSTTGFTTYPESYLLEKPLSPHAAAKFENENIKLNQIQFPASSSKLIIEGAGGLLVPINYDNETICDLIIQLKCPVVLVVKEYLGNINHTLLSLEHLKQRAIPVFGIVYVGDELPETSEIIEKMTGIKTLFRVPLFSLLNKDTIRKFAQEIQIS